MGHGSLPGHLFVADYHGSIVTAPPNRRLERTRHERASLLSCVGEPLKRSVGRFLIV